MKGEKEFFRKRLFGGFNREDVTKYIAKVANERNDAYEAKEKAEKKMHALEEELNKLKRNAYVPIITNEPVPKPVLEAPIEVTNEPETAVVEKLIPEEFIADEFAVASMVEPKIVTIVEPEPTPGSKVAPELRAIMEKIVVTAVPEQEPEPEPKREPEAPKVISIEELKAVEAPKPLEVSEQLETVRDKVIKDVDALIMDVSGKVEKPKEPSKEIAFIDDEIAQIRQISEIGTTKERKTETINSVWNPEASAFEILPKEEKKTKVCIKVKKR
ncbi:MAG: hypothetical protein FWD05_09295 [Oscillospiraceae bacterium]|nr:hypothetical protein [Oscillospiraceae bacterium]